MTEHVQDAVDFEDDEDEDEEILRDEILRAKWTMDGARTLAEAAGKLRAFADAIDAMIAEGYELSVPVADDYAFIRKATTP